MFERFLAVPLHFTIEFLGFLVVAGGAFLVMSRPALIPSGRSGRSSAALGFAALAAAQVIHGGAFPIGESDASQLLVALKALGMALILIGVVGAARPSVAAAFAQGARPSEDLVAFAPSMASAAVVVMALASSTRGSRELRRLALAALLLGAGEALIPFAPTTSSQLLADSHSLASHLLRTAGYLAMASWLWTGVRSSIRTRFVASFVTLLVAVILALSSALTGVIANNVESSELVKVSGQLTNVVRGFAAETRAIGQLASLAAENPVVRGAVAGGDPAGAARAVLSSQLFGADTVVMMTPRGKLLARAGKGGNINRSKRERLLDEDVVSILGAAPVQVVVNDPTVDKAADLARIEDSVALIGAAEVPHPTIPNRIAGAIALVDFVDFLTVDDLKRNVGNEVSLVVGGNVVATTLRRNVTASDIVPRDVKEEVQLAEDGIAARASSVGGATFYNAVVRLTSQDGFGVGYLVLSSPSELVTDAREDVTRTLFLVALGVAAIVLVLAYYSGSRITRPIQTLTETAQRIREGDLKAQAEVAGEDEVGQLGETFNEMTSSLFRMTNDLREAAREEHELRSRIETIIQSMADGLVAVGADGRVLAFNREAEQLTGLASEAALGASIEQVLDARDAQGEKVNLPIFDLAEGSVAGIFIKNTSGDNVPVSLVSAALRDEEGETAGGVAVLRDMTREREVERMKSEFLSNISHELRTPLTPIKGYAEILDRKRDLPPEKAKQFTAGILESTAKLERIVELLVDFAALEAGRLSPRSASVDVAEIIQKLAREWEQRTPRHSVVADVGGELPEVIGDERLLRRSFEEILDNAVKFSPHGGTIRLEVRGSARQNGGERRRRMRSVEVTVSDEGIGIQPEDVNKIFSDFHQLDGSETRSYGGLGLGLAFVRRIVEAHDGTVSVQSEPDEGTRLIVSIPAAKPARKGADN
ncbi:MAG TPA: ATP-binding protein [Actinomycetota bacterium]|nr:ATP-binding protein [Actinomycetota bacterium]